MASKRFQTLERTVEREYKRRGFSTARASRIAHAVAGQVALRRRQRTRQNPTPRHCGLCGSPSHDRRTCPRASAPRRNPPSPSGSRRGRGIRRNPDDLQTAMRVSKLTNGRVGEVVELSERERRLPRYVAVVGDMVDVTYRPPEGSKRGRSDYRHESGDRGELRPKAKERPVVGADPVTRRLVVVPGKSPMRLTRRGLVG